jgi:hypothetical protein
MHTLGGSFTTCQVFSPLTFYSLASSLLVLREGDISSFPVSFNFLYTFAPRNHEIL